MYYQSLYVIKPDGAVACYPGPYSARDFLGRTIEIEALGTYFVRRATNRTIWLEAIN